MDLAKLQKSSHTIITKDLEGYPCKVGLFLYSAFCMMTSPTKVNFSAKIYIHQIPLCLYRLGVFAREDRGSNQSL